MAIGLQCIMIIGLQCIMVIGLQMYYGHLCLPMYNGPFVYNV